MTAIETSTVRSADGIVIGYHSLGTGEDLIVVGGALKAAADYLPLAQELADSFRIHVVDRRGRGLSGPQGDDYSLDKEHEDLCAVQAATSARRLFGHSYGGLIALEAARRSNLFADIAVYEPGISVQHSLPSGWMQRYLQLLNAGEDRRAFACMVKDAGFAPRALTVMPLWYVNAVLKLAIRGPQWKKLQPLLTTNLAEHEQVNNLPDAPNRYADIHARVLLLGGTKSPSFISKGLLQQLHGVIANSTVEILPGLSHLAPDETPIPIAQALLAFLQGSAVEL